MLQRTVQALAASVAALLLVTGCSNTPVPTAPPAEVDVTVPWSGNLTDVGFVNPAPMTTCAAGWAGSSQNDGSGSFGYLGAGTYTARWCGQGVSQVGTETVGAVNGGFFNITLATGELIYGNVTSGQSLGNTNCARLTEVHGEITFTGGTGRFAGRTGTGNFQATQVNSACPSLGVVRTLTGTIRAAFFNK
jgi:hypothetical protein